MDYTHRPPPDFSTGWKLKFKISLFLNFTTQKWIMAKAKDSDVNKKNWFGYRYEYFDDTGLAQGNTLDFLGKGVVLKFWGLRSNGSKDRYEFFSTLYNGIWLTFSNNDYRKIWGFYGMAGQEISAISLVVFRKTEEAKPDIYRIKIIK